MTKVRVKFQRLSLRKGLLQKRNTPNKENKVLVMGRNP